MKDVRDELYDHMLECMGNHIKVDDRQRDYVKEYMQRYADYCLQERANGDEHSDSNCNLQAVSNNEVSVCPKCGSNKLYISITGKVCCAKCVFG